MRAYTTLFFALSLLLAACSGDVPAAADKQFTLLDAKSTGVDFRNDLPYNDSLNCYLFRNFYNGGGVGIGDMNNDGLPDLFFCGNLSSNKLYLNRGNFKFEDITEKAGLSTKGVWTAGVALADINGDGLLDIYACKSGPPGGARRSNELFLNQGNDAQGVPNFKEAAAEWGLQFTGLSTHAAFFDYDHDGDLDCYLLNNSIRSIGGYDYRPGQRDKPDPDGGNRLLRNELAQGRPVFTDVTQQAGIYSSAIGFGLGVTVGDYDRDGWQDLYISNDFFERDYLYRNRGDGSFEEVLTRAMTETGKGAMGADMADLDNDGFPEIFVTEMTAPDERRYKTKAIFDDWNTYNLMRNTGYHRQFGRNVLQHNRGDGTFAELGRQAGVWATDWSWGALLADFDNDGRKDIFVANGIGKDLLDQDYLNFYSDPSAVGKLLKENPGAGIRKLIDAMPSEPVANYCYRNEGDLQFSNQAAAWGLDQPSFSNGSAYGDLDNDGDLDLVVNNANMPCFLYRNESKAKWLKINISGEGFNKFGLGARVTVQAGGVQQYAESAPMRGFESCVEPRLHFGLGQAAVAEWVEVVFPSGKVWRAENVAANQILQVSENAAQPGVATKAQASTAFLQAKIQELPFRHQESDFSDFNREPLLFQMYSNLGPALAVADVNADGQEDVFLGGAAGQASVLLLGQSGGKFSPSTQVAFAADKAAEDVTAAFFDADGDGDADLYVGSGSNEFEPGDAALQDRLYLNDGRGRFSRFAEALPGNKPFATSCVRPADFDADGDTDLFVGMRLVPGHYGRPAFSFLLKNDGKAHFQVVPPAMVGLKSATDAQWVNLNGDQYPDLAVVSEWEPLRIYLNENGQLREQKTSGLENTHGWWNALQAADLDGDGDVDFIAGNHGLNSRFRAAAEKPLQLYVHDFDANGIDETILCQYQGDKSYPVHQRADLVRQLPILKKKYLKSTDYQGQTMTDIFTPAQLAQALVLKAEQLQSCIFRNMGNGRFRVEPLPAAAQRTPVYAIALADMNGDGLKDLLLGGNQERCKPETGVYLATQGQVFLADGKGGFGVKPQSMGVEGEIRAFGICKYGVLVGGNNSVLVTKSDE
ncbi:MAG: VCBS repeat-containing protein [Chitinophagales bacterium]|nr:VCBS repeat-containing protein [Chitinophagales bacterium]